MSDLEGSFVWRDARIAFQSVQPALSPQQRYLVAGDLYMTNRAELIDKCHLDQEKESSTDAEIIARLWESFEDRTATRLEGMFAFAVWDRERETLTLVRDPTGARTIYYTTTSPLWVSPSPGVLESAVSKEIDLVALRDYLCCAFVPGARTMRKDIREVRPGSLVRLPEGDVRSYWQVEEKIEGETEPIEWHAEKLRSLLERVLIDCLPANDLVGAYLSGGLDSSAVVALACALHSRPVHTYSIHFGSECPNELEWSSLVASHCQTIHTIIEITPRDMWELLPETMAHLDDPIGDPLTVPNLLLGRKARESVSVILNGEGGDPCFGGPKNQPMLLSNLYTPANEARTMDQASAYLASFQKCWPDIARLMRPDVFKEAMEAPFFFEEEMAGEAQFLNRLMFINIKFKGADHILTKVNNLTRAAGLRAYSPLFDQRVIEMSLKIPPRYKLSGAQEKAVLKKAVCDLLPESILLRPKSGMMVPVQLWFRKRWQREARALLLGRRARIREFLNQELIRDWIDYRGDVWSRYGVKLWLLASLEIWLQTH
ncbi:MAG: asparagine synthase-related protein [Acidobacteriota bacterium]